VSPKPKGFPSHFPVRDIQRRSLRYWFVSSVIAFCIRVFYAGCFTIEGRENIPREGGYILCGNHLSVLDPLILGAMYPETLFAMAKTELFRNPILSWILAGCNTFPVDRGKPDRFAINMAVSILASGGRLILFIEGTRSLTGSMAQAEPGLGFLVRHAKANIIPFAIFGTEQAWPHGKRLPSRRAWTLRIGKLMTPEQLKRQGSSSEQISDTAAEAIADLLPHRYQGAYATGLRHTDRVE